MQDCVFCKIVVDDLPSEKIYEDKQAVVFLDISPITKGHVLVVPKVHYKDLLDTPDEALSMMIVLAKKIAPFIVSATGADGFNIGINNGHASGQVVDHIHLHVIPRFNNDNLKNWQGIGYRDGEMGEYADKIRGRLPEEWDQ